ncbi:MAG: tetratricopeptide repeat protein [Candidatus Omnitrophica bacterium]|nr:tetratricopeptide repeat protein [Candidatus Omnitrophota bacterium]
MGRKPVFNAVVLLGYALIGLAVYANSLQSPFIWDDPYLVVNNHLIRDLRYLPEIFSRHLYDSTAGVSNFYRPLQTLFLLFDFSIWKLNPLGYHLTSLVFHILCAFFSFLLFDLLFGRRWVAVGTGLLFLVHPINSTVVDYISSRADSQAAFFSLLSLWLFFKAWGYEASRVGAEAKKGKPGKPGKTGRPACAPLNPLLYLLSLASFLCALLSKEMAVAFPLLLLAAVLVFRKDQAWKTIPFVLLLGLYAALRLTVLNFPTPSEQAAPPLTVRLLTTAEAFVRLIGSLFVPVRIHIEKSIPFSAGFWEFRTWGSIAALLAIGFFMAWVYKRSKGCFFGLSWFFIALLPMANIVPINTTIADHWLYLPSIGFFASILGGIADGTELLKPELKGSVRRGGFLVSVAVLVLFSALTIRQNRIWRDPVGFFELAIRYSPGSFRAHNELGVLSLDRGEVDRAVREFQEAVRINPAFDQAHDNLGIAYDLKGDYPRAIVQYQKALQLNPHNPKTYNNLGNACLKSGQFEQAIRSYEKALQLNPGYKAVYNNLGAVYFKRGEFGKAQEMWEKALQIDPDFEMAASNLKMLKARESAGP